VQREERRGRIEAPYIKKIPVRKKTGSTSGNIKRGSSYGVRSILRFPRISSHAQSKNKKEEKQDKERVSRSEQEKVRGGN